MIKIVIKGNPVSVNNQYGKSWSHKNRFFGVYLSNEARAYRNMVIYCAKIDYKGKPLEGDLKICISYFFRDTRRRDHLNYNKVLLDALEGICYLDDKQIKESHHKASVDKKDPRIEILIKRIKEDKNENWGCWCER